MSLSLRIFLALVFGLAAGIALAAWGSEAARATAAEIVSPIGGLWLDALQMTVIPLVLGLLFTGLAGAAGEARASATAGRALLLFAVLVLAGATTTVFFVPELLRVWPVSADAAAALKAGSATTAAIPLGIGAWLRSFVPTNVFAALAEGKMLQLVVFTGAFAMAATRLPEGPRAMLVGLFDAITAAMLVLVHWVLALAPIGVFALAAGVGIAAGAQAVGVLAHYVTVVIASQLIVIMLVYAVVAIGTARLSAFARAVLPAQVVAVSTQSSIATLPAMLDATRALRVPEATSRLVLPMAVSIFRVTSAPANLAVVLYVATLTGTPLTAATLVAGVAVAFAVSIASVGLPGQVSFITSVAPICLAMGVPIGVLPLLIAVELVPDIFRTLGNVTADIASAVLLGGRPTPEGTAPAT
ncbi:hypothetical protein IP88_08005 [alpha proteobacterium AAP81b]|nr:hypothetical protein IP88_08005 [alpha proteobacterium AAP81b]